ncbi:unnamed protein product [Closterium sp. NIES-64]|nr:unnamed protein product [Closterium sp. NIES-64]
MADLLAALDPPISEISYTGGQGKERLFIAVRPHRHAPRRRAAAALQLSLFASLLLSAVPVMCGVNRADHSRVERAPSRGNGGGGAAALASSAAAQQTGAVAGESRRETLSLAPRLAATWRTPVGVHRLRPPLPFPPSPPPSTPSSPPFPFSAGIRGTAAALVPSPLQLRYQGESHCYIAISLHPTTSCSLHLSPPLSPPPPAPLSPTPLLHRYHGKRRSSAALVAPGNQQLSLPFSHSPPPPLHLHFSKFPFSAGIRGSAAEVPSSLQLVTRHSPHPPPSVPPPAPLSPPSPKQWPCSARPGLCGVMHRPIRVYLIWFGPFSRAQKNILRSFIRSISDRGDPENTVPGWWDINRQYHDCKGRPVSSSVTLKGESSYPFGRRSSRRPASRRPTSGDLTSRRPSSSRPFSSRPSILRRYLPFDTKGVYFVISSPRMKRKMMLKGFCTAFCGWHSYINMMGKRIKTSLVGNPAGRCLPNCAAWELASSLAAPNRDKGMDALVSTFAHELAEATSDPYLSTWMNEKGEENADMCSYSELAVATSDRHLSTWMNDKGEENVDMCSYRCVCLQVRFGLLWCSAVDGMIGLAEATSDPYLSTWMDE